MDGELKYLEIRETIIGHIKNSDLKQQIKFREMEIVNVENTDHDFKVTARVGKSNETALMEFKETLYDLLAEKIGNEEATEFVNNNVDFEVGIAVGEKFQGLDVQDSNGSKIRVAHEAGSVLMLDFWATWCGYCQDPMQENVNIMTQNNHLKENNISIVGLSCDEDTEKWKSHVALAKWDQIPQYVKKNLLKEVGVRGIPCIAIINKSGIVDFVGHPSEIKLEEYLINLAQDKTNSSEQTLDSNDWWNSTDSQTKSVIVAEAGFSLSDVGVINAKFCVTTRFELNNETFTMVPKKVTPMFYGEVTPYEYDTIQNVAINLQTTNNFNDFAFKVRVLQMEGADF
jgi:thiol-disulfide isomerase/thioredoxin